MRSARTNGDKIPELLRKAIEGEESIEWLRGLLDAAPGCMKHRDMRVNMEYREWTDDDRVGARRAESRDAMLENLIERRIAYLEREDAARELCYQRAAELRAAPVVTQARQGGGE